MAFLAGLSVQTIHAIASGNKAHADTFVPAKRLTAAFEREVLNARIFFIYYVTIQKPGSLDSGWLRFHQGEAVLHDMTIMVNRHDELANLRGPVAHLGQDVANYSIALDATLKMVSGGEIKGPHYDAQVKEWAARGATMVKDSAFVENMTFQSGEANAKDIAAQLRAAQTRNLLYFLIGAGVYSAMTLLAFRRLKGMITHEEAAERGRRVTRPIPVTLTAQ